MFDLAPFAPGGVAGELWIVSTVAGEVTGARIDATLVVNETGPWSMGVSFDLPTGLDGFSSEVEGWSGAGTFAKSFETHAFDGLITPPAGTLLWSWFLHWTGGTPFTLPGGGSGIGPLDGTFTELRLTLTLADCPFGDPLAPWTDVGGALAGSAGTPSLVASGSLCPAEAGSLFVAAGAPGATAIPIVGASHLGLPIADGALVPTPDLLLPALVVAADGTAAYDFNWPTGAAPGLELWVQVWTVDPAAPLGLAATNGLRALAP